MGAGGTGDIPSFAATNATLVPISGTITRNADLHLWQCFRTGNPETFTITVNPKAHVNDPADQVVCHNNPTAVVTYTTNNAGGTVTDMWTTDTPSIGLAANGTGNIPSFSAINTTELSRNGHPAK
ncbi:MAG: hypothetical protein R2751_09410 [Bacteroidales bacterium]